MAVKLAPHVPRTASNDGVVDAAVRSIAEAHDELEAAWRPLAEAFATLGQQALDDVTRV